MATNEMLYTVPEVARLLKTNTSYVYKLKDSGQLKFMKLGRLKCRRQTLEEFLARNDGMDISDPYNITALREGEKDEESIVIN